jgi:RND family efflux transporter MFP subunit
MNYDARIDAAADGADPAPFDPLGPIDEDERRARRRMWIGGAIAVLVVIALWLFLHRDDGKPDPVKAAAAQAPSVTVIAPGRTTVQGQINATGTLAARRELPVGVAGEGGQIAQVLVEPGQWVGRGQVLATIDRSVQVQQAAAQAAQIQVARADAQLAQANLERAQKLVARGFISKADIDRLTATRDAAAARVRVASAQLGETKARVGRLNIVAPAAGLVLERKTEPGQVVSSGSGVLFRIAQGGEIEMLAQLSETDLAKVGPGVSAEVTPVGSQRAFTGQIWQVSPVIDPQTRLGRVRIALAYAPELRPGGFASAVIRSGTVVAPVLPESAVLSDAKGSFVYLVNAKNRVERRPVTTGEVTAQGIPVVAGLNGTERVVLRAGGFLNPGDAVHPVAGKR